jgi:F-box and leucine-rich repeat protein GRR1
VTNVTDQAIHALVDAVSNDEPTLERVHLSFCDNLSVQAITHLLKHIPGITHLSLTGVTAFRDRQYQAFCRAPPAVSIDSVLRLPSAKRVLQEFNAHQRGAFCVFSGKGVSDLRECLLRKERTERNARDDPSHGPAGFGQIPRFQNNTPRAHVATYGNATLPSPPPPAESDALHSALNGPYNIAALGLPLTAGFSVAYRNPDP